MRKCKYYLYLSPTEHYFLLQCLLAFRNKLITQGKYPDAVDELIIKLTK